MHTLAALAVGLLMARGGLPAAEDAGEEAVKKELRKLEGGWKPISLVIDGKPQKLESTDARPMVIKDNTLALANGEQSARLALDPSKKPSTIEIVFTSGPARGTVLKGTYKFNGDLLVLATHMHPLNEEERFRSYDANGDGKLSEKEMPESLRLDLARWDANKDGVIDLGEFKAYLRDRVETCLKDFTSRPDSGVMVVRYERAQTGTGRASTEKPKEATRAAGAKWEYRVLTRGELVKLGKDDLARGLNKVGEEGWELASVAAGIPVGAGRTAEEYYFKRPAAAKRDASAEESGKTVTKVFPLRFAKASEMEKLLDKMLGKRVRLAANDRTNQLIVEGDFEAVLDVAKLLQEVDAAGK
jgi:uncharacterized protein (TIGR03067 family)